MWLLENISKLIFMTTAYKQVSQNHWKKILQQKRWWVQYWNSTTIDAAEPDGISAELMKYAPTEVHKFVRDILNDVLEHHEELDLGKGILVALQKLGKSKGLVKNLRPVILLLIIRKILSNITSKRIKPAYDLWWTSLH